MGRFVLTCIAVLVAMASRATAAPIVTISFDDIAEPGTATGSLGTFYNVGGYSLSANGSLLVAPQSGSPAWLGSGSIGSSPLFFQTQHPYTDPFFLESVTFGGWPGQGDVDVNFEMFTFATLEAPSKFFSTTLRVPEHGTIEFIPSPDMRVPLQFFGVFRFPSEPEWTVQIDTVTVRSAPEPGAAGLFAVAFACLAIHRHRRRRVA